MAQYGRKYANESEKSYRLGVFTRNLDYVNAFRQAGNHSYTLGLNEFADLTKEEFTATYTTTITRPSASEVSYPGLKPFRYGNVNAPSSIDWRDKGAVTEVRKQGGCGACWAFAAVAAIEGINQIVRGDLLSLSEQELIACDYNNDGCEGGLHYRSFSYVISSGGMTTEERYPYNPDHIECHDYDDWDILVTISGYEIVPRNDEKSLMKAVANQPVAVGIDSRTFQFYSGGIYDGPCAADLDHEVTLVGYDTDEHGTAYWIAKNSWGKEWGDDGYLLIAKDVAEKEGRCGLAITAAYPVI
ncbi:hypothetical protein B296_00046833 [Ensete ventricosum]|uniref:Peptidase C1A papain C-terminal domain-containing protein n=1 Tax=Ensete ventricosum TaxID=4639 RepID=A0A426XMR1_ENSVE|nr:hypothetical protein B296_00046833 [Ensete ventricosum]